jgi:hypothetical protein
VSRADNIAELAEVVSAIRLASRNPDLVITIDGTPFSDRPDWVATIGADAVASTGGGEWHGPEHDQRRVATA